MNNKSWGAILAVLAVVLLLGALWWAGANNAEPLENGEAQNAPLTNTDAKNTSSESADQNEQRNGQPNAAPSQPMMSVTAQLPDVSGVTVREAALTQHGYIVIHEDEEGQPGDVIGVSDLLEPATYRGFTVMLDRDTHAGERLYAMLHTDDGDGEFTFPQSDPPTRGADGLVVVASFPVTTEAGTNVRVDTNVNATTSIQGTLNNTTTTTE